MDKPLENQWIEIFRSGNHTDANGKKCPNELSEELIDNAIKLFKEDGYTVPICKGHPKDNLPAFGWVSKLKAEFIEGTKRLYARFKDVVPSFEREFKQKQFANRSSAFRSDGSLRHIAFLGAEPPAVKDMEVPEFAENQKRMALLSFNENDNYFLFDFSENNGNESYLEKQKNPFLMMFQALMDIGAKDNQFQEAVQELKFQAMPIETVPENGDNMNVDPTAIEQLKQLFEQQQKQYQQQSSQMLEHLLAVLGGGQGTNEVQPETEPAPAPPPAMPPEPPKEDEEPPVKMQEDEEDEDMVDEEKLKKAREDERKKVEAEFAERAAKEKEDAAKAEFKDFCEKAVADGKIPPAWIDGGIVEFANSLDVKETLDFSENAKGLSRLDMLKSLIDGMPKMDFSEQATRENDVTGKSTATDKFLNEVEKTSREKGLNFSEAQIAVMNEQPDLYKAYAQEM